MVYTNPLGSNNIFGHIQEKTKEFFSGEDGSRKTLPETKETSGDLFLREQASDLASSFDRVPVTKETLPSLNALAIAQKAIAKFIQPYKNIVGNSGQQYDDFVSTELERLSSQIDSIDKKEIKMPFDIDAPLDLEPRNNEKDFSLSEQLHLGEDLNTKFELEDLNNRTLLNFDITNPEQPEIGQELSFPTTARLPGQTKHKKIITYNYDTESLSVKDAETGFSVQLGNSHKKEFADLKKKLDASKIVKQAAQHLRTKSNSAG